jgi:hypothetical protein
VPDGVHHLFICTRNFTTAVVAQLAINPYLTVLLTTDDGATVTDGSGALQDASTATSLTLSSMSTAANADYLYVGSHIPFRGVNVDVGNTNGTASVLTVKYWKTDSTWATITATDGTASAGATLAQDGNVTWTVPTDWFKARLVDTTSPRPANVVGSTAPLYWTRWEVSVALDSSVTVLAMNAMNRSTAYFELVSEQVLEQRVSKGPGGMGCIEAKTDAGTANLIVNVAAGSGSQFV